MSSRVRVRAASLAGVPGIAVVVALAVALFSVPADAQQSKKLDKAQMQEAQALTDALNAAEAGGAPPADITLALENCWFFRASNGQTYVPFTVTTDVTGFPGPAASVLLRVVRKGAVAGPDPKADKQALPRPAYEDLEFPTINAGGGPTFHFSRAFQVAGGDYEIYVAMKDRPSDKKQKPRLAVLKRDLSVPAFVPPELMTSTVVVTDRIEALQGPLQAAQQREQPYTIGQLQIFPKSGITFAKDQELNVYFQIYNADLDATSKKPDVLVEYGFFQRQGKKIFNSDPTVLNATSLPSGFDPARHPLAGGGAWPVTSFPAGDYRLEIKVTDKVSGKSLTRTVDFSVA